MWQNTGKTRPAFAIEPGPGQESVWDYPRPPALVRDYRHVEVRAGDRVIAETESSFRVCETASPPTFYLPPHDVDETALIPVAGGSVCEWKGVAGYYSGKYEEAADAFGRMGDATGFFNRGNAFMKSREYRKAIASYEVAVEEAPGWTEAEENLELARYVLDYIERVRESSDTGEEAGIGADEVVFDNESGRGTTTEVTEETQVEAQSAEKWMRTVDTETSEFLRTRFLLESQRREEP